MLVPHAQPRRAIRLALHHHLDARRCIRRRLHRRMAEQQETHRQDAVLKRLIDQLDDVSSQHAELVGRVAAQESVARQERAQLAEVAARLAVQRAENAGLQAQLMALTAARASLPTPPPRQDAAGCLGPAPAAAAAPYHLAAFRRVPPRPPPAQ